MKFVLALTLSLTLSAPALAQDALAPDRIPRLNVGLQHLQKHENAEALAALDPLLADYEKDYAPEKRAIYCAQSQSETVAYMLLGAADKKNAVAINPGWCYALWGKGFVLADMKRYAEAVPYLERAVAMAPYHSHYLSELGYAHQSLKNWQRSYDAYARAAEHAGLAEGENQKQQFGRSWRGMAFNLVELGRWDEAEAVLKKALALDPADAKAQSELDYIAENRPKKN